MNKALKILTVVPAIVDFGKWVAGRIRARRAARKAGQPLPVDLGNVAKAVDDAQDIAKKVREDLN